MILQKDKSSNCQIGGTFGRVLVIKMFFVSKATKFDFYRQSNFFVIIDKFNIFVYNYINNIVSEEVFKCLMQMIC